MYRGRPSVVGVRAALVAWHVESLEGYQAWMEVRMVTSTQKATNIAWKVAKNAL